MEERKDVKVTVTTTAADGSEIEVPAVLMADGELKIDIGPIKHLL